MAMGLKRLSGSPWLAVVVAGVLVHNGVERLFGVAAIELAVQVISPGVLLIVALVPLLAF